MSSLSELNFDRVADIYRWAEYAAWGSLLQSTRTHFLPSLRNIRNAWVIGDGDGRFSAAFLQANAKVQIVAVDSSRRMLTLLRRRCAPNAGRLSTFQGSAQSTAAPPATDLIVTHFFLDCLTRGEVETLAERVVSRCRPGTLWLVSDFQIPENSFWTIPAKIYIRLLYRAFRVLTGLQVQHLPDVNDALHKCGFRRRAWHHRFRGFLYTELWVLDGATQERAQPPAD